MAVKYLAVSALLTLPTIGGYFESYRVFQESSGGFVQDGVAGGGVAGFVQDGLVGGGVAGAPGLGCSTNVTAWAGQTARMFCCLATHNQDLGISWVRKRDVVILSHGVTVFTTDQRFKVFYHPGSGIWELRISRLGKEDMGLYECQANSEPKTETLVNLNVEDTTAQIVGPKELFIKAGSRLKLNCRVELGPGGPDDNYRANGVLHWFQDQRLLDPGPRDKGLDTKHTIGDVIQGWLTVKSVTAAHSGNYTCVPSYTKPDWVMVHIIKDEAPAGLHDGNGPASAATCHAKTFTKFLILLAGIHGRNTGF